MICKRILSDRVPFRTAAADFGVAALDGVCVRMTATLDLREQNTIQQEYSLKAPGALESRASLRSSQVAVLASSGFLECTSPFQSRPRRLIGLLLRWLPALGIRPTPLAACRPPRRSRPTIPGCGSLLTSLTVPGYNESGLDASIKRVFGCAPRGLSRSSAWCRLRCRAPHRGARSRRQSRWTRTRSPGRTRETA